VRLGRAAVVGPLDAHGGGRGQASLTQPALQGARRRDIGGRVVPEQVDAEAPSPPGRVAAAQGEAGVADGLAAGGNRPAAAAEVGGKVVRGGPRPRSGDQVAHGACRQAEL
jgi:hypothetical protein